MDLYEQWSDVDLLQLVEDMPLHSGPSEVASPHTSAHLVTATVTWLIPVVELGMAYVL